MRGWVKHTTLLPWAVWPPHHQQHWMELQWESQRLLRTRRDEENSYNKQCCPSFLLGLLLLLQLDQRCPLGCDTRRAPMPTALWDMHCFTWLALSPPCHPQPLPWGSSCTTLRAGAFSGTSVKSHIWLQYSTGMTVALTLDDWEKTRTIQVL